MNRVKELIGLLRGGRAEDNKAAKDNQIYNKMFGGDEVVVDDKSFEKLFVYGRKRRAKKNNTPI